MKIRIKARGVRLRLWFPTSILKTRIGYNVIKNMLSRNEENKTFSFTREQHLQMYKALKQCIKLNGHFNLVEVESHDGEKVLIRV